MEHAKGWLTKVISHVTDQPLSVLKVFLTSLDKEIRNKPKDAFLKEFGSVKEMLATLKEGKGRRCIHFAAARGDLAVFQLLAEDYECDVEALDDTQNNAFFTAVQHRHQAIVAYLIESRKVAVDSVRDQRMTALFLAAMEGDTDMASYLLSKGADI